MGSSEGVEYLKNFGIDLNSLGNGAYEASQLKNRQKDFLQANKELMKILEDLMKEEGVGIAISISEVPGEFSQPSQVWVIYDSFIFQFPSSLRGRVRYDVGLCRRTKAVGCPNSW
jgi:hypothetical protein